MVLLESSLYDDDDGDDDDYDGDGDDDNNNNNNNNNIISIILILEDFPGRNQEFKALIGLKDWPRRISLLGVKHIKPLLTRTAK